jgi:putative ATP-dependent endonuclease of the OLD family
MKLLELQITNFRSLKGDNVKISFSGSDIIFLIGQNNFGKSSILAAYEYFVAPKQKACINDFFGFSEANPIEMIATFLKDEGDEIIFEEKGFEKWVDTETGLIKFRKRWTKINEEGQKETWNPLKGEFELNGFGGIETHLAHEAPTPIRIPALPSIDDLTKWIKDTLKKTVLKQLKVVEKEAYDKVIDDVNILQRKILSQETIKSLSTQANLNFQKVFPDLKLNVDSEIGSEFDLSKALETEFSVTITDPRHPCINQSFSINGHGVIRQTMFNFLGLVKNEISVINSHSNRKEYLLLFEEPEIYLHPKAVFLLRQVLYELCKESKFQILCSSHSPLIIDISKPHTSLVRVVRDKSGNTSVYQAGDDVFSSSNDIKEKVQMINKFNPHICESFFSNEVILVEGDTEAIICRELLNQWAPESDIFVVNTGSKNNIPFFQKIFNHFRIKQFIFHDSDTRFVYNISVNDEGKYSYLTVLNKNGITKKKNSAWALNEAIWDEIQNANEIVSDLAQRFVFVYNFETAHDYFYDPEYGKPLSAYLFIKNRKLGSDITIENFIKQIIGIQQKQTNYSQEYIEVSVKEPI